MREKNCGSATSIKKRIYHFIVGRASNCGNEISLWWFRYIFSGEFLLVTGFNWTLLACLRWKFVYISINIFDHHHHQHSNSIWHRRRRFLEIFKLFVWSIKIENILYFRRPSDTSSAMLFVQWQNSQNIWW